MKSESLLNWDTATSLSLLQEGSLCVDALTGEEDTAACQPGWKRISLIPGHYLVLIGKEIAGNITPQAHLEG